MDKTRAARLARYLADNNIDPHEAITILQEVCRQLVLARLNEKKAAIYDFEKHQGARR